MLDIFKQFDGSMSEDSVAATVYAYWQYHFYKSLFNGVTIGGQREGRRQTIEKEQTTGSTLMTTSKHWTLDTKLMLMDNFDFDDFYQNLV